MNAEINQLYKKWKWLRKENFLLEKEFSKRVNDQVLFKVCYELRRKVNSRVKRKKYRVHEKKFEKLGYYTKEDKKNIIPLNERWLINTTNVTVLDKAHRIPQLGPKFVMENFKGTQRENYHGH